ncbi:glycosyltransferase [Microbacterium sp.]|uniref:glycosyltransferase n=1 Tax=Microbacterium sp. TaxID=51671 RepID=UPI003C1DCBFA
MVDAWRGRERALRERGVDVRLFSAGRSEEGGEWVALRPRPGEAVEAVDTLGRHPALFLYDPRPLWRSLGEQWDVIDIHEEPFSLATAEILLLRAFRRNRAPVILYTAQNIRKRYPIPFRWFERYALRLASGISACNADAAAIASEKGFAGRARVIPLGIDPAEFTPVPERRSGGRGAGDQHHDVVVGYIGRLVPEKGIDLLLRALALEPRLHLRVAGSGPLGASLPARALALGVAHRMTLIGAVEPDEVATFYRSVDVIAVPSLTTPRWTEQFGRVAVEAMASGVPVVASDAGALPDVVGGAGLIVRQGNVPELATALVSAGGERASDLIAAGALRAAECSWTSVADDYIALYRSVTHAEGPDPASAVEIVVVAYGRPDLLRAALEPVAGMPLTVVDNSSLPEIAELCTEFGVRYIDPGRNGGFGAGVNRALVDRLVPGADVLLLNPDARITSGQIAVLQNALRSDRRLASVAPSQVDESGRPARVEWRFPSPGNAWREAIGLSRLQRGARFVIGSVLLLRAEALDQVGGFDEAFFLYAEETDWAYRAQSLGWRHTLVPAARVVHVGAATSSDGHRRDAHFHASQERYFRKHFGAIGWQSARVATWGGAMFRAAVLPGARGTEARRRAALYRLGPMRVESRLRDAS